jgi:hypothetical protein
MGSILLGWATPTEGAGMGALGSVLLTIGYGKFTWKRSYDALLRDTRDFRFDPVPGRRFELFWRSLFKAWHAWNDHGLACWRSICHQA